MTSNEAYGEPSYYELICQIPTPVSLYYPIVTVDCYLIIYKPAVLLDPSTTPLCQFYYAGIKKYLIGDDEYAVYDINVRELDRRSRSIYESEERLKNQGWVFDMNKMYHCKMVQWWLGNITNSNITGDAYCSKYEKIFSQIESASFEHKKACVYKC